MEQDMIIMQDIFRYKQLGIDQNGRTLRPVRGDRRAARRSSAASRRPGIKLPSNLFQERVLLRD